MSRFRCWPHVKTYEEISPKSLAKQTTKFVQSVSEKVDTDF